MFNKRIAQKERRNAWALLTVVVILAMILSGCGPSKSSKVYKVGILLGLEFIAPIGDGFKAGMSELGYVEGENIVYDIQLTNFDIPTYQTVIQKFVDDKVDLIIVSPTEATLEAKSIAESAGIPVVFTFAFTEGMGIIENVREPGGNITGVRFPGIEITLKRYEILRKLVPDAKRIWLPYQAGYPIVAPQLEALEPLAKADGVTLLPFPANNAAEVQAELEKFAASDDPGIDAIMALVEPLFVSPDTFEVIAKFAYEHKIPFGGAYYSTGEYTSIFGVNVDFYETGRLAAPLADKIFNGVNAGTIPVSTPENFIQINYAVAKLFGITVPDGLLKQANEVIQ